MSTTAPPDPWRVSTIRLSNKEWADCRPSSEQTLVYTGGGIVSDVQCIPFGKDRATARERGEKIALAVNAYQPMLEALEKARSTLHHLMRTGEMSSGIMRDRRRTGGWAGASKTADAFDRMSYRACEQVAELDAAIALAKGEMAGIEEPKVLRGRS